MPPWSPASSNWGCRQQQRSALTVVSRQSRKAPLPATSIGGRQFHLRPDADRQACCCSRVSPRLILSSRMVEGRGGIAARKRVAGRPRESMRELAPCRPGSRRRSAAECRCRPIAVYGLMRQSVFFNVFVRFRGTNGGCALAWRRPLASRQRHEERREIPASGGFFRGPHASFPRIFCSKCRMALDIARKNWTKRIFRVNHP